MTGPRQATPGRDDDAGRAAPLAFGADGFVGQLRPPPDDERRQQLEELARIDRAAAQLGVDDDVVGDRGGDGQRLDELGSRIDGRRPRSMVGPVADGLDPAGGRAGADRDERRRLAAQAEQLLELLVRADRALDEEDVERSGRAARGRLREFDDVEPLGDREQVVLEVEDGQLAAVARGELDDTDARPARSGPAALEGDIRVPLW